MAKIFSIKIDNPCSQNWEEMFATDEGRFCNKCQQTVVDFTGLSDLEIINNLQYSNNGICGRFNKNQLDRRIQIDTPNQKKYHIPKFIASIILLPLLSNSSKAQTQIHSPNDSAYIVLKNKQIKQSNTISKSINQEYIIYGKVQDSSLKQNLSEVSIKVKNNKYYAVSDSSGNFVLKLPIKYSKLNFKINIERVGYNKLTIKVQNKIETFSKKLNIYMHPSKQNEDEVIVVGFTVLSE